MSYIAINLSVEQMVVVGFALGWGVAMLGAAIRMMVNSDRGGDPNI